MRLLIERIIREIYSGLLYPYTKVSYSQNGEDLIIKDLFHKIGIPKPTYLDIGANEPYYFSNTYLFYSKGCTGVCIEPNPQLFKKLRRKRPRDICLNMGIAFREEKESDFYLFDQKASGLGTFSKEQALFWEQTGAAHIGKHKIKKILKIPMISINTVIQNYFHPYPNFISLDTEGTEFEILKTLDFDKYRPEVLCIETLGYKDQNTEIKNYEINNYLQQKGYMLYADTYINSIFCCKEKMKRFGQ